MMVILYSQRLCKKMRHKDRDPVLCLPPSPTHSPKVRAFEAFTVKLQHSVLQSKVAISQSGVTAFQVKSSQHGWECGSLSYQLILVLF